MPHRTSIIPLLALAALTLAACVGPFASDDATQSPTGATEGFATICGIELTSSLPELGEGTGECFLDGHNRGAHRELFLVQLRSIGNFSEATINGSVFVTRDGELTLHVAGQLQGRTPSQSTINCDVVPASDREQVFDIEQCTPRTLGPRTGTLTPDPATAICGAEVVVHSDDHFAANARRCLLDAFEAGTPARFYSMRLTTEGDPVTEVYSVTAPRELELLIDNRDAFGTPGVTLERCTQLLDADTALVWEPANCFLIRKAVR